MDTAQSEQFKMEAASAELHEAREKEQAEQAAAVRAEIAAAVQAEAAKWGQQIGAERSRHENAMQQAMEQSVDAVTEERARGEAAIETERLKSQEAAAEAKEELSMAIDQERLRGLEAVQLVHENALLAAQAQREQFDKERADAQGYQEWTENNLREQLRAYDIKCAAMSHREIEQQHKQQATIEKLQLVQSQQSERAVEATSLEDEMRKVSSCYLCRLYLLRNGHNSSSSTRTSQLAVLRPLSLVLFSCSCI